MAIEKPIFGIACILVGIITIVLYIITSMNELWIVLGAVFFIAVGIAFLGLWIVERMRKGSFVR